MRSLHWEESDIVTLLGWLNYCVANGDNFWQSIVAHLQESRRLNSLSEHDFTKIQIRNKLIGVPRERILKHSSNKPFPKLADLLSRGTACIPGLSPPTTAKINDEVVKFKKRYKRHNTPERSNNEGDVVSTDCSAIHTPTISDITRNSNASTATSPLTATTQNWDTEHFRRLTHDSLDRNTLENVTSSVGGVVGNPSRLVGQESQDRHERRIRELMEKNQRLEHEIKLLHNARDARQAASHELGESDFYLFYRQGWDMQRRLNTMERAMNFHENLLPAWENALSYADVSERMDKVQFELQSMAYSLESLTLRHDFVVEPGTTLDSLIGSGFRLSSDTRSTTEILRYYLSNFDFVTTIHTLALTAVRDWVLHATFPIFQDGTVTSGLFDSWRTVFLECAGPRMTHTLEATAYSRFIDSGIFKDGLIPQHSTALGNKFIEATATLFPPHFPSCPLDSVRDRLIAAFTEAFHFKVSTVLMNSRRYQLQIYPPELQESASEAQIPPWTQSGASHKFVIQGRLTIYNTLSFNQLNRQANVLLDADNFLVLDGTYSSKACLYSKAIVAQAPDVNNRSIPHLSTHLDHQRQLTESRNSGPNTSHLRTSTLEIQIESASFVASPDLQKPRGDLPPPFFCVQCNSPFASAHTLKKHNGRKIHISRLSVVGTHQKQLSSNKKRSKVHKVQSSGQKAKLQNTITFPGNQSQNSYPIPATHDELEHIEKIMGSLFRARDNGCNQAILVHDSA